VNLATENLAVGAQRESDPLQLRPRLKLAISNSLKAPPEQSLQTLALQTLVSLNDFDVARDVVRGPHKFKLFHPKGRPGSRAGIELNTGLHVRQDLLHDANRAGARYLDFIANEKHENAL
jgi:hypothetical protein